ncbi:MAG: CoA transferase [Chloroflexi bacterium]|nr:CoA transferase [Chloroflexota bacterium]
MRRKNKRGSPGAGPPPLEGVRVLDFGQAAVGPFCTQLLAWMGAEVVLIETRGRLLSRETPPFAYGRRTANTSGFFNLLGNNKVGVTLNLATSSGLKLAREIVKVSDVVVENFTTGTMERLGLGYQELRRLRPDLIMLSVGGFGRTGSMARYAALHSGVTVASGIAMITGYPGGRPRIIGGILPDTLGGLCGCLAVLEAVWDRQSTGRGHYIDFSMSEVLTHMMPEAIFDYAVNGREPQYLGNRDRLHAPQGVYRCQGWDAWVGISVTSDAEWRALCDAIGQREMTDEPHFATEEARQIHHDELDALITKWTRGRSQEEAVRLLQQSGVPAGPSFNAKDLLNDPHLKARGFVHAVVHPEAGRRRMLGLPWHISGTPPLRLRRAPLLGEHTQEVIESLLGLSRRRVRELKHEGALS